MATAGGVGTESGAEPEERLEHAQPLRAGEADGLVTLEVDDTYVLAVVSTHGDLFAPLRADHMRADPELRENVVWRMFEVEGAAR